jgi:hypothetical protein
VSAFSIALFFVFARYRLSMVPLVMLFAAAGVRALAARLLGRRTDKPLADVVPASRSPSSRRWSSTTALKRRDDQLSFFNLAALVDAGRGPTRSRRQRAIALQPDFAAARRTSAAPSRAAPSRRRRAGHTGAADPTMAMARSTSASWKSRRARRRGGAGS